MKESLEIDNAVEAAFHDAWADETDISLVAVRSFFESPAAYEHKYIFDLMGDVRGKRILDVGAGIGESAVYFALHGAEVVAADISSHMLEKVTALGERHGVTIKTHLVTDRSIGAPDSSFDIIHAANVIHHLQDRLHFYKDAYRMLTPGGKFIAVDPLKYNPLINVYRLMARSLRTPGEQALGIEDICEFQSVFRDGAHKEFWLCTNLLFLKYFLVDRAHPGTVRYWKKRLDPSTFNVTWFNILRGVDDFLLQLPLIRYLAWNVVLSGTKLPTTTV